MHLLLVNNTSSSWAELTKLALAAGHSIDTADYYGIENRNTNAYDAIILSGGMWYDDAIRHSQSYKGEMELIANSSVPILGICLGMQLMQVAYGGAVPLLPQPAQGAQTINLTDDGQAMLQSTSDLTVIQNHTRGIRTALPEFEILADSTRCIEIMRHRSRPLIGVQFHPELDQQNGGWLLNRLLNSVLYETPNVVHDPALLTNLSFST